jgi:hypothetical protein
LDTIPVNNISVNRKSILEKIIYHHKLEHMVNPIVIYPDKVVRRFSVVRKIFDLKKKEKEIRYLFKDQQVHV